MLRTSFEDKRNALLIRLSVLTVCAMGAVALSGSSIDAPRETAITISADDAQPAATALLVPRRIRLIIGYRKTRIA